MRSAGVGIDVVPVRYQTRAEIIVERVAIPADVRRGQPFDLRVVVTNTAAADGRAIRAKCRGRLVTLAIGRRPDRRPERRSR